MDNRELSTEVVAGVYLGGLPSERRFSLENPNLPLNAPGIWEEVFGDTLQTDAGISINEDKALTYAPVWQAVSLISSAVACLPFHHYRRLPDISATASERVDSTQDYLVSVSPSGGIEPDDYCTAVQFWEMYMLDALLWNNAFAYISYDGAGRAIQLRLLNPDRTNAEMIDGRLWYVTEFWTEGTPRLKALFPWEVLHIRGLCAYGHQAPRFIRYARNSIALGLSQQKFASKFFAHGGRVGGILELPAGMPKPARDTVEDGFRKTYEDNDTPFKTVILRDSAKFHQAQTSPTDAQMVEGTEEQVRMIARWFGLSPALLGLSGSVSYNSKEQDNQAFLDHCLKRWLRKIQAECGIKLLPDSRQRREFFKHDVSDLISLDAAKQAAAHQIYRQINVLSPNEVRAALNMLPREGGDSWDNPNTSAPSAPVEPDDDEPDTVDPPEAETPSDDMPARSDWRARRVLHSICLYARIKARTPSAFVHWIDGGLKMQREEWKQLTGDELEPSFIAMICSDFQEAIATTTAGDLLPKIDAIATSYEQEM